LHILFGKFALTLRYVRIFKAITYIWIKDKRTKRLLLKLDSCGCARYLVGFQSASFRAYLVFSTNIIHLIFFFSSLLHKWYVIGFFLDFIFQISEMRMLHDIVVSWVSLISVPEDFGSCEAVLASLVNRLCATTSLRYKTIHSLCGSFWYLAIVWHTTSLNVDTIFV